MKFISIDTETTGVDHLTDQILEFGAVLVDTETHPSTWPTFQRIIKHNRYEGSAYAIQLNNRLFQILAGVVKSDVPIIKLKDLSLDFKLFLKANGYKEGELFKISFIAAGKNVSGFDLPFLNQVQYWNQFFNVIHRTIDPGSMYVDVFKDQKPPDLAECKRRANLPNDLISHNALEDAWDVVYVVCADAGWNFKELITEKYLTDKYKLLDDDKDLIWSYDNKNIISLNEESNNLFNTYFIQNILTSERRYVWNKNEL